MAIKTVPTAKMKIVALMQPVMAYDVLVPELIQVLHHDASNPIGSAMEMTTAETLPMNLIAVKCHVSVEMKCNSDFSIGMRIVPVLRG